MCVGNNLDLMPLCEIVSDIRVVAPVSGSPIWVELFVNPKRQSNLSDIYNGPSPMTNAWFDYILSPARSKDGQDVFSGFSPLDLPPRQMIIESCPSNVTLDPKKRFLPNRCSLNGSELMMPLDNDLRHTAMTMLHG